jgi:cysteine desulfurase
MKEIIYLDNSATTKPFQEVVDEVMKYMIDEYGNPSSLYRMGITAEKGIRSSREEVAKAINSLPEEIFFTSGGTESNNLAIWSAFHSKQLRDRPLHMITTEIEHPSVYEMFRYFEKLGVETTYLAVDRSGRIDLKQLEDSIKDNTCLVSIMHVNNDIGTIQEVEEIGNIIFQRNPKTLFHVDGVQAFCRVPISLKNSNIHFYTMSGHKIHGPKGVGALYIKKGVRHTGMFYGGGQEQGLRPGTENVPAIMGFGKAVQIYYKNADKYRSHLMKLKQTLSQEMLSRIHGTTINGPHPHEGAPHIINISFTGVRAEVLLHALEQRGIMVGTGSACSSRRRRVSHVLTAIGLNHAQAEGAIRFSLSPLNTEEEIYKTVEGTSHIVKELRRFRR